LRADVRVVCATHRDLERAVADGRFREDLYYRVRVVEIDLPPLRARGAEEIEALARHFADLYAARYGRPAPKLEPDALAVLAAHAWPGNVRELEHWIESAVVLSPDGRVAASSLPSRKRGAPAGPPPAAPQGPPVAAAPVGGVAIPIGLALDDALRRYTEATLAAAGGNKSEAAKRLGIGRNTLARLLRKA
jgi:Nif-specific regulatory protein